MSSDYRGEETGEKARSGSGGGSKSVLWGCLLVGAAGVVVLSLVGVALLIFMFAGVASAAGSGVAVRGGRPVQEWSVGGAEGAPKVALIPVQGALVPGSGPGEDPVGLLRSMLKKAQRDDRVKGIVLQVASGGGAITTCDIMRKDLLDFKKETGKPVVTLMGSVTASGAYYVSCGTDHLVAHPTTITGSIGVLWPFYDASGLLDKVGVEDRTVKSGRYKQLGSPFAERTEEESEREKEQLQGIVDEMHSRFVQIVAEGRGMERAAVEALATGRIFTSREAVQNRLIDAIGYREDAVAKVKELAGLDKAHVVQYGRVPSLLEVLLSQTLKPEINVRLGEDSPHGRADAPMYLWPPSAR